MHDFSNRTLFLTGASGAIPRAVARAFYANGANLFLTDLDLSGLTQLAHEIDPSGGRVAVARVDVSNSVESDAAARSCADRFGGIDHFVTAAGYFPEKPTAEMSDQDWQKV